MIILDAQNKSARVEAGGDGMGALETAVHDSQSWLILNNVHKLIYVTYFGHVPYVMQHNVRNVGT